MPLDTDEGGTFVKTSSRIFSTAPRRRKLMLEKFQLFCLAWKRERGCFAVIWKLREFESREIRGLDGHSGISAGRISARFQEISLSRFLQGSVICPLAWSGAVQLWERFTAVNAERRNMSSLEMEERGSLRTILFIWRLLVQIKTRIGTTNASVCARADTSLITRVKKKSLNLKSSRLARTFLQLMCFSGDSDARQDTSRHEIDKVAELCVNQVIFQKSRCSRQRKRNQTK